MKYLLTNQQTNRLIFRNILETDFNDWLPFHQDPMASQYWVSEKESPEIECAKWYENQFNRYKTDRGGFNALIEKESGRLVGHCGLLVQVVDGITELEVAYSLLPEFWNKGYASEAAIKCREFSFDNLLATSLISIISLTNLPSERVALKNGMAVDKQTIYNGNPVNIFRVYATVL